MSAVRPLAASTVPGLRTLSSPRFRVVLAAMLAIMGLASNAVFIVALTTSSGVPWLEDFQAYFLAAERIVSEGSPYLASQVTSPVDATCPGCYLYPPFLAQVLVPLTALPMESVKYVWVTIVLVAAVAGVWLALAVRSGRPSLEHALWSIAAATLFYPMFQNTWLGNTSAFLALAVAIVALGGVAAGLAVSLSTLLKLVPAAFVPVVLPTGRRPSAMLAVSLAAVGLVCFALAPEAWREYPAVLRNMLAGSGDVPFNLALSNQVARLGAPEWLVDSARIGSVVLGLGCMVGGVLLARRTNGLPAAVTLGTVAMLVIPGTLWYHYLAVLLPIAAMAWVRGDAVARAGLLAALIIINVGGTWDAVVSIIGAVALIVVAGWVLWPRADTVAAVANERRLADPA